MGGTRGWLVEVGSREQWSSPGLSLSPQSGGVLGGLFSGSALTSFLSFFFMLSFCFGHLGPAFELNTTTCNSPMGSKEKSTRLHMHCMYI